ncbi:MAG TPA: glycosyltransferase [Gemmatimonadales bacterium]|nr:glycosyltransferase [Gemmatimonadales bacterium]
MDPRPVTLCIINYNGERRLDRVLAAAARSELAFEQILVVDDGSTDGSVALLRDRHPRVRIVVQEQNQGPGAARNAGWRAATTDLVLFIDNDVTLDPGCAGALRDALARRLDALVAQPRVLYANRPDTIQYDGADCHVLGLMILRHAGWKAADAPAETVETRSMVTCAFMVNRASWRGDEPFDTTYIFNLEDHDFGVRSRLAGHLLLAVPSATCRHGDGTPGLSYRGEGTQNLTRVYCLIRNRWRIVAQSYSLRTILLLAPGLAAYEVVQLAGAIRKGWLGPWTRAAWWMARNPGTTLRRRRAVQAARRVSDRELLVAGPLPFTPGLIAGGVERLARRWVERVAEAAWRRASRFL